MKCSGILFHLILFTISRAKVLSQSHLRKENSQEMLNGKNLTVFWTIAVFWKIAVYIDNLIIISILFDFQKSKARWKLIRKKNKQKNLQSTPSSTRQSSNSPDSLFLVGFFNKKNPFCKAWIWHYLKTVRLLWLGNYF